LDASGVSDLGPSGVTTHVNKVHHVTTINRVAEQLGENEDWLRDVASEMEIEDGVIWVYGVGEDGVLAFTDFGIESLIELIKMYKDDPTAAQALRSAIMTSMRPTPDAYYGMRRARDLPRLRLGLVSPSDSRRGLRRALVTVPRAASSSKQRLMG